MGESKGTMVMKTSAATKKPHCWGFLTSLVDCRGLEPRTLGLRVPCSTN